MMTPKTPAQLLATQEGAKLAKEFCRKINCMSTAEEFTSAFINAIMHEHRTLQQGVMRSIYNLILEWAKAEELGYYDGRNEATVKFCQSIKALAEKDNVAFPFI